MSQTYSQYCTDTGCFTSVTLVRSPGQPSPEGDPSEGLSWWPGLIDRARWRVDIASAQLVPYEPPRPADTEWATYSRDEATGVWVATPTLAAIAKRVRAERDRRMDATVSVSLKYYRLGEPIPQAWADYMQALADVPEQPGFPTAIDWPAPPTATP